MIQTKWPRPLRPDAACSNAVLTSIWVHGDAFRPQGTHAPYPSTSPFSCRAETMLAAGAT